MYMSESANDTAHVTISTIIAGGSAIASLVLPAFQLLAVVVSIIAGVYAIAHWRLKINQVKETQHEQSKTRRNGSTNKGNNND